VHVRPHDERPDNKRSEAYKASVVQEFGMPHKGERVGRGYMLKPHVVQKIKRVDRYIEHILTTRPPLPQDVREELAAPVEGDR
jgi:hypothetical protein